MNTLAYIVIGALVLAIVGGVWATWQRGKDDFDDFGGPYL